MQDNPLLHKLDWVFTSSSCTLQFPNTSIMTDHVPYVIKVGTDIPKTSIFRFKNFWVEMASFLHTIDLHWNNTALSSNSGKTSSEKFKQTMRGLKACSK